MEQHSKFRYLIQRIIKYVIRGDNLERWNEVFLGQIPDGIYQTRLSNGEEDGLIIELTSDQNCVQLIFGIVEAIRMIDEGMVQEHLYSEKELKKNILKVRLTQIKKRILINNFWKVIKINVNLCKNICYIN